MSKKAFGGVGHGGTDPGAVGSGLKEADINLDIALSWESEMKRHGVETKLSRYKNENDDLNEEVRECNAFKPDVAIDFHTNAGGGDGFEVYHSINGGLGKTLAQNIEKEVIAIGQNSRGIKTRKSSSGKDYYGFIRNTSCPANIIECAFIDNSKDIAIVGTKEERIAFGIAVAKGTLKTLGVSYKDPVADTIVTTFKNGDYSGRKAKVTASTLNVRYDRGTQYNVIGKLNKGDIVKLNYCLNGWISIEGFKGNKGLGYVSTDYLELI